MSAAIAEGDLELRQAERVVAFSVPHTDDHPVPQLHRSPHNTEYAIRHMRLQPGHRQARVRVLQDDPTVGRVETTRSKASLRAQRRGFDVPEATIG